MRRAVAGGRRLAAVALLVLGAVVSLAACRANAPGAASDSAQSTAPSDSFVGADVPESESQEANDMLNIQIGDQTFTATLADNSTVTAFRELLADGPLTLVMQDYAGMEKGADLGVDLPQNNEQMNAGPGDIILYQGRTFVIYYDTNTWSLTPIGKIEHVDADALRSALGDGDVTVTLSLG